MGALAVPKVTVEAADADPPYAFADQACFSAQAARLGRASSSHSTPVTAPGPVKRQMGLGNFKEAIHR